MRISKSLDEPILNFTDRNLAEQCRAPQVVYFPQHSCRVFPLPIALSLTTGIPVTRLSKFLGSRSTKSFVAASFDSKQDSLYKYAGEALGCGSQ